MSKSTENVQSFKIPSAKNRYYRRAFYGLHRRFEEPIEKWLKRIENRIDFCGFEKFTEYLLIDKFFSDLNNEEISILQSERQTWSLKQLHQYLQTEDVSTEPDGRKKVTDLKNKSIETNTSNANDEADPLMPIQSIDVAKMDFENSEVSEIDSANETDDVSESHSNITNHDEEKPFACAQCDKRFTALRQLERHLREECDESFDVDQSPTMKKRKNSIPNKKDNVRSQGGTTATKKRTFTCNVCNKVCGSRWNLQKHNFTHTGEKPYACDECDLKFNDPSNLKKHKQRKH